MSGDGAVEPDWVIAVDGHDEGARRRSRGIETIGDRLARAVKGALDNIVNASLEGEGNGVALLGGDGVGGVLVSTAANSNVKVGGTGKAEHGAEDDGLGEHDEGLVGLCLVGVRLIEVD